MMYGVSGGVSGGNRRGEWAQGGGARCSGRSRQRLARGSCRSVRGHESSSRGGKIGTDRERVVEGMVREPTSEVALYSFGGEKPSGRGLLTLLTAHASNSHPLAPLSLLFRVAIVIAITTAAPIHTTLHTYIHTQLYIKILRYYIQPSRQLSSALSYRLRLVSLFPCFPPRPQRPPTR